VQNDFTKEELNYIADGLARVMGQINWSKNKRDRIRELYGRVESMIDNYCDHDFVTFLQDQNNDSFLEKCLECHELRVFNE
jgi:hypothetical protein